VPDTPTRGSTIHGEPSRFLIAAIWSAALVGCGEQAAPAPGIAGAGGSAGVGAGSGGTSAVSGMGGSSGDAPTAGDGQGGASTTGGSGGQSNDAGTNGATAGSGVVGGSAGDAGQSGANHSGGAGGAGSGAGGAGAGGAGASGAGGAGAAGMGAGGGDGGQAGSTAGSGGRSISFGTLLDAQDVMRSAQELAAEQADPMAPAWRAKGDQRRSYHFAEADRDETYRLCVPDAWDGTSPLPLVMFLHGAGSDENTYLDQNGEQMVMLAEQHGYLLVSPSGADGAYGNFLRLSAPFGDEPGAAELMAQVTDESERVNQLSERDVINVLELVLAEYPVDRDAMFLTGHSMGSGGTWYIGGKYASYWRALGPMSGPFVQQTGYPWESLRPTSILVTEGTQTPSLAASLLLAEWLSENGFTSEYLEVNADHGGMVALVLPEVFDFFDQAR
jgi:predicted esterase